jgi:hypothetical protein
MRYIITYLLLLFSVSVHSQLVSVHSGGAGEPSPLLDSLFAYYSLDESSGNALDSHGSNDLPLSGTVTQNVGSAVQGTCYTFVTDGYLGEVDTEFEFDASFSIQVWMKSGFTGGTYTHLVSNFGTAQEGWEVAMGDNYRTYAIMRFNTGSVSLFGGTPVMNDDAWHHVVFTYNAVDDSLKIYDNAVIKDAEKNVDGVVYNANCRFTIGRRDGTGVSQYYFDGEMDEIAIWRGLELSQGKIDSLYNSGSGLAYPLDF